MSTPLRPRPAVPPILAPAPAGRPVPGGTGPPDLSFRVGSARVVEFAAAPTLEFALLVDAAGAEVRSLALDAQIRIRAPERAYEDPSLPGLRELFGERPDWGRNLRSLFWVDTSRVVPAFTGAATVALRVPCGYDFDVSASKYLNAVREGEIPLEFLFSGTVFYAAPDGALRAARLPWDREARYAMPAALWQELMESHYPNAAWIRMRRDLFDRLDALRAGHSPPTWDATIEALLERDET